MKNKHAINIGLMLYLFIVIGVAVLDPYKTSKRHMACYFFMIILSCILILLKKIGRLNQAVYRRSILTVCSISLLFFAIIGGAHLFSLESEFSELSPNRPVTLIENTYEMRDKSIWKSIFRIYYLKHKKIVFHSEKENIELVDKMQNDHTGVEYDYSIEYDSTLRPGKDIVAACLSYPCYFSENNYVYVVDEGLKKNNKLICFEDSERIYFCSEELYRTGGDRGFYKLNNSEDADYYATVELGKLATGYSASDRISYNMWIQIIAALILMLIGGVFSLALWGEKSPLFSVLMSLPIGVVIWSMGGIITTLAGVKMTALPQLIVLCIILTPFTFIKRKEYLKVKFLYVCLWLFPYITALIYFVCTCHTYAGYDSMRKMQFGLLLIISHDPRSFFSNITTYGIIEPYTHALGYMLGGDYLYALYPMFFITSIVTLFWGSYIYIADIKYMKCDGYGNALLRYFPLAIGIFYLVMNYDYRYGMYFVMSHGLVSLYFLMIFVFFVLKRGGINGYEYVLTFSSIAIMLTRVEGIVYVLFLLTVIVGYINEKETVRTCIGICVSCLTWVTIQLMLFNGEIEQYFFTPSKAIILYMGSAACILYIACCRKFHIINKVFSEYHFYYIAGLVICNVLVSVLFCQELASDNLPVFISHMSNYIESDCNSGFLWLFVFLLMPIVLAIDNRLGRLSFNVITGYILLVFLIFLFRGDLVIHGGMGDSGRRVLVQIMPTAVWLVSVSVIDAISINKIGQGER